VLITALSFGHCVSLICTFKDEDRGPGRNSSVIAPIFGEMEETGLWIAKSESERQITRTRWLFVSVAVIHFFNDTTNERADSGRTKRNLADHHDSEIPNLKLGCSPATAGSQSGNCWEKDDAPGVPSHI
jgi:hypothetical protein